MERKIENGEIKVEGKMTRGYGEKEEGVLYFPPGKALPDWTLCVCLLVPVFSFFLS